MTLGTFLLWSPRGGVVFMSQVHLWQIVSFKSGMAQEMAKVVMDLTNSLTRPYLSCVHVMISQFTAGS